MAMVLQPEGASTGLFNGIINGNSMEATCHPRFGQFRQEWQSESLHDTTSYWAPSMDCSIYFPCFSSKVTQRSLRAAPRKSSGGVQERMMKGLIKLCWI